LYVKDPLILKDIQQPVIILRAGPYNEEIKKQILNEINANSIFI
jgi:hypothetical protein